MTEQRKKFSVEFNYLEMLGLHDYSRFKNKNLKDIVLQAIEKEIASDKEYLDSLIEDKKDFFIAIINHDLVEQKAPVNSIEQSKILNNESEQEPEEENIDDDLEDESEDSEEKPIEEAIKAPAKNKPRFLRDIPLITVKPKKKKKAKSKPVKKEGFIHIVKKKEEQKDKTNKK